MQYSYFWIWANILQQIPHNTSTLHWCQNINGLLSTEVPTLWQISGWPKSEFYFNFPKLVFNCHNLSRFTCTLIQIVVVCTGNHLALYLKLTKGCIFGQHILLDFILLVLEICFSQKAKQRQVRNSQNPF